ncbi:Ig-like domain-containing protein, partial [Limnohabitans sp. Rim8]|uniref:beta strand repeat-containing protein n=1 Tax=Limnohabitans sp. Rim8 TaxID=1100718 RepID=UPI0025E61B26
TNSGDSWSAGTGSSIPLTGDGNKSIIVKQTDAAGNVSSTSAPLSFTLDTAAPAAPGIALATNSGLSNDAITNVGTVNVTGLEGGSSWQYSTDGSTWNDGNGTSFAVTGDGAKSVSVRQTDVAGNLGAASSALTFTLDSTAAAPSMSLATDSGVNTDKKTNVGTVNVSGLEPGASWQYSSDGNTWTPGTGTSFTVTGDGAKSVSVKQTDVTGNTSSASAAFTFTLDTVAAKPTLAYTNSGSADDSITNVGTVTVSGLETGASWQYSLNGTDWNAGIGSSFAVTGDGAKSVSVQQTDLADNSSGASNPLAFTLDATAPSVVVTKAPGNYTFNFAFSEAVTSFDASDVAVPQGTTKGTFTAVSSTNYTLVVTPPGSTSDQLFTVNVAAEAAIDVAGNASTAATQLSQSLMVGTAGADTLTSSSALSTFIDLSGGGNDTVKLATASASTAAAPDLIGGFGSGDKIDLSAILKTISGYTSSALADTGAGFVELENLTLSQNATNGKTTVNFDVAFDSAYVDESKITGAVIDLAYNATNVNLTKTLTKVSVATFSYFDDVLQETVTAPVWIDTLSESFNIPTGKFAALATPDDGTVVNPIITNTGKAFSVRLIIDSLVSTFEVGLDAGTTELATADGKKHIVDVGVTKTAGATVGGAGSLAIVTDADTLGTVTDNQLHMLVKYVTGTDTTQLRIQYDSNSATGTTALSEVIALDFSGNVTANLTPAALTFI